MNLNEPKKRLTLKEAAMLRFCWLVEKELRDRLDKFFLIKDSWQNLEPDLTVDDVELKRYLQHDGQEYEVILLSPVRVLKAAVDLGLSFRINIAAGMKIVLIKEWKEPNHE